jgi:hypothetical protein
MSIDYAIPPLRDLPTGRLDARKAHLVAEAQVSQPRRPLVSWPRFVGPRRHVAVFAMAVGLLVIGTAVAATTDWLTGRPAPKSVVSDFGSYTPQLGFSPEPGRAVLVAHDGDVSLYATINKQGSYCLIASAAWKRPSKLPDGGTCVPPAQATAPLIAGLVGASSSPGSDLQTYLIAGRTSDPEARAIRFSDPTGTQITRAIGSSGFFVVTVHTQMSACANGDWKSKFSVLGGNGEQRASTPITLGSAPSTSSGVCVFAAPHA